MSVPFMPPPQAVEAGSVMALTFNGGNHQSAIAFIGDRAEEIVSRGDVSREDALYLLTCGWSQAALQMAYEYFVLGERLSEPEDLVGSFDAENAN